MYPYSSDIIINKKAIVFRSFSQNEINAQSSQDSKVSTLVLCSTSFRE